MVREGQLWYYEICELFGRFCTTSEITYCGFERVTDRYGCHLAGVFEFPQNFRFTDEFCNEVQEYSSDRIAYSVVCNRAINRFRHCVIVVLK